jgi:CDK inhibitor PHO81
LIDKN